MNAYDQFEHRCSHILGNLQGLTNEVWIINHHKYKGNAW